MYARLGVRPVINARSWVTALGGSLMAPEVLRAMQEASTAFVDLHALHRAAGEVVARACDAEAGLVTGGAAAGNILMAAACMTGMDPSKIDRLPDTTGMKDELVIFHGQRNHYDNNFEVAGARLVEWGFAGQGKPYQLDAAITDRTCAVAWVAAPFIPSPMTLKELVDIAHGRGVPVIVDAAAEVPPPENLTRFTAAGADMVAFSGGKGIGGPQGTGLLAGRRELVEAAFENHLNTVGTRAGVGRASKASKEDIVGLVTALEMFMDRDHESVWNGWRARAGHIVDALRDIPGLRVVLEDGDPNRQGPQPVIYFTPEWRGPSPAEVRAALEQGDPPIYVGTGGYGDEINVVMVNVQPGEERIIADRLSEILADGNGRDGR